MEFRVEGRRPVDRSRRTWLYSVEADITELEIDKDYVNDRKIWRYNVMKRKSTFCNKDGFTSGAVVYVVICH